MKGFLRVLPLLLLVVFYIVSKNAVDARVDKRVLNFDERLLPSPKAASFFAMGFKNAAADVFWIEGLNYFGDQLSRKKKDYRYLTQYCDLIVSLDAYFVLFYEWASTSFIYNSMPIVRESVLNAIHYVNLGIQNLSRVYRYDAPTVLKGAFNYALEAKQTGPALSYFEMAARISKDHRDMFLVASTYAAVDGQTQRAADLKLEYLTTIAFEAESRQEILEAVQILSSSSFHSQAAQFIRAIRLQMEQDEEMRRLVEGRISVNPIFEDEFDSSVEFQDDARIRAVLSIDFSRTWMPSEMLTLFSI